MKKSSVLLFMLLFTLLIAAPIHAQEETPEQHPLLTMLSMIPDNAANRATLSYIDYRAIDAISGVAPGKVPLNLREDLLEEWSFAGRRIANGPSDIVQMIYAVEPELVEETVGFEFFDINQAVEFALPPGQGRIFIGDFDLDAVREAHIARDYTEEEINGVQALCSPDGCDAGLMTDPVGRNTANIFDSRLGRKPPVLLYDGILASAFALPVVEGMADASMGEVNSLLDAPVYATAAEALLDPEHYSGELVQVLFQPAFGEYTVQVEIDYSIFESREQLDTLMQPIADEWRQYGELPQYSLLALADRQEGDMQKAIIVLTYDNAEDAAAAVEEVSRRVANFSDQIVRELDAPLIELLAENHETVQVDEGHVYTSETTGFSAAVISVTYSMPTESEDDLMRPQSGLLYGMWIRGIFSRGFYPVWQIILPEWFYEEQDN